VADSKQQVEMSWRILGSTLRPEPLAIYKAKKAGGGVAAKFNLRIQAQWPEEGDYVESVEGGLFVDLVPQAETKGVNATFDWKSPITAKLGLTDVSALLVAYREVRGRLGDVPGYLQAKQNPQANTVSLFHKNEKGSSVITYAFGSESSILRISTGADSFRSIAFSLSEELLVMKYLDLALEQLLRFGAP
jgi:hypothetical protein